MPKVSVIIPSYNSAQYVTNAIDSVLNQTYTNYEIIVVDDGSIDNTKECLNSYYDKIHYIFQDNKGLSGARNTAIKAAKGEWIALLDADDEWFPEKLEKQLKVIDQYPEAAFIFTDTEAFDEKTTLKKSSKRFNRKNLKNGFTEKIAQMPLNTNEIICQNVYEELLKYGNMPAYTPTIMFKKECLERAGYFNEKIELCEDYECWIRISKFYDFYFLNSILTTYRITPAGLSGAEGQIRGARYAYGEANAVELNLKNLHKDLIPDVKKRMFRLYFNAVWSSYRVKDYGICIKSAMRSLRLRIFQPKIFIYLILALLNKAKKRKD